MRQERIIEHFAAGADPFKENLWIEEELSRVRKRIEHEGKELKLWRINAWPSAVLLTDGEHLQDQQLSITVGEDRIAKIHCRLTKPAYAEALSHFQKNGKKAVIDYESATGGEPIVLSGAYMVRAGGATVRIATGFHPKTKTVMRTANRLIEIEIPLGEEGLESDLFRIRLAAALRTLGIEKPLDPPHSGIEQESSAVNYKKHYGKEAGFKELARLKRKEVRPGYYAWVDEGKHKEYRKITPFALFSTLGDANRLPAIMLLGVMSTRERFERGMTGVLGMASMKDLETGGANSGFVRVATPAAEGPLKKGVPYLIYPQSMLDRCDWRAYPDNFYGTTDPQVEAKYRQYPEEFLRSQSQPGGWHEFNELMFRDGTNPYEEGMRVACSDEEDRARFLEIMRAQGVGDDMDDIFVVVKDINQLPALADAAMKEAEQWRHNGTEPE